MAGLLGAGVFPSTRAFGNWTVSAALHWDHNQLLVNPSAASSPEGGEFGHQHSGGVIAGPALLSGSEDNPIRVWNLNRGSCDAVFAFDAAVFSSS